MKISTGLIALALLTTAGMAHAAGNCSINLKGNDSMQFDLKEVTVSASCPTITINLQHPGKLPVATMGHNVVIAKTADIGGIEASGIKAGVGNNYLQSGDARVIAATKLIGGGESTKVSFAGKKLTAGGDYSFFCSFPGHSTMMKGKLKVTK